MFEKAGAAGTGGEAVEALNILVSIDDTAVSSTTGEKGIFGRRGGDDGSVQRIPVAVLRENLQRTVDGLQQVLRDIRIPEDGMPLREAQVSFEITASGGIALVGTSAQVAAKGAITLTFGS